MAHSRFRYVLLVGMALLPALVGCSSRSSSTAPATPSASGTSVVEQHLNSPGVSDYEKEQIRKHMPSGGGGTAGKTQ
jgi:hypothetical protein